MSPHYRIEVEGRLDPHWSRWFHGLTLAATGECNTIIAGPIADQSALHGVLDRIRDLGLVLVSVESEERTTSAPPRGAPARAKEN